jgi:hypothetical protein
MPETYYLDTRDYYYRKIELLGWHLLRRSYYEGNVYSPTDGQAQLWKQLMRATDAETDLPLPLDNLPRMLIDNTINDVLPAQTELLIPGIEEVKEFFADHICCGPAYARSLAGFRCWLKAVLRDVPVGGDGLLFLRLLREDGKPPVVRLHYYPAEDWDCEQSPDADCPLFYRVEYTYKGAERTTEGISANIYWRRFDIWKDRIVRYADTLAQPYYVDDGVQPPALRELLAIRASLVPPDMNEREPQNDEVGEMALMQEVGEWIAIPITWQPEGVNGPRGIGPLTLDRLCGVDDNNRLLTKSVNAAIKAGGPMLAAVDLSAAEEENDPGTMKKSEIRSDAELYELTSTGEHQGKLMYPENQPVKLLHDDVRKSLRQAILQGSQSVGLSTDQLIQNGDVSGFAMGQITHYHEENVQDLREQLIDNAIIPMLQTAIKMLQAAQVPIKTDGPPEFKYPAAKLSADETVKMGTAINILSLLGTPPKEMVKLFPGRVDDVLGLIAAWEKKLKEQEEMQKLLSAQSMAKSPKDAGGVDKQARGTSKPSAK